MKDLSPDIKESVIYWMSEQQRKYGDLYFRTCDVATSMKLTLDHARDILNELYDADILDYIPPYRGTPLLWFIKTASATR